MRFEMGRSVELPTRRSPFFPVFPVSLLPLLAALSGIGCAAESGKERKEWVDPALGSDVFHPAPVHRFSIELPADSIQKLQENNRTYVRGTLREGGESWANVGIHIKGSAGSLRPLDDKPAFTIKIDKFLPVQRYRGLRKLVLNNAVQDPSYLSDFIGNEIFRAAGIPAFRVGFARVKLKGRDLGFYLVLESTSRDFLGRWFKDPSGNLYEGPGEVDNPEEMDVDSHGGQGDRSDLKDLTAACSESDPARRLKRLKKILDVDRFYTFSAVEIITWHWDGYLVGKNNYNLYHDPKTGRFVFFPHGLDQLFGEPGAPILPPVRDLGLVARVLYATADGRKRYRERVAELLPKILDPTVLGKRIDEVAGKIRSAIGEDGPDAEKGFDENVAARKERIAERARNIQEQLSSPEPAPRKTLTFDAHGVARPKGWEGREQMGQPEFTRRSRAEGAEGPILEIHAPAKGEWCGSYRTRVVLPAGAYVLSGRLKTVKVRPLPETGEHGESLPSGAGLRISGQQPAKKLLGDQDWTRLEFHFQVEPGEGPEEEPSPIEVELVCELRAARGTAWIEEGSLEIRKVSQSANKPLAEDAGKDEEKREEPKEPQEASGSPDEKDGPGKE